MRVKVDVGHLTDQICQVLNSSRSKKAKELNWGISIGYDIFLKYLQKICERAIEINDPIIQEYFLDLCMMTCTDEEEKEIREKAKEILNAVNND